VKRSGASFRDPSGYVFREGDMLLRAVHVSYAPHYDLLKSSGLYQALTQKRWLIPHDEVAHDPRHEVYHVLRPELVPYVSYPYEWCFGQLKDAALLTLDIQILALAHGMVLKDASAYNIQFIGSRPVFIDTLSFEHYVDGAPWVAYRQFCQHFLGPLALMAHRDLRLRELLSRFIDGIPLDLVARLLPRRTMVRYGLLAHLHLHAGSQRRHSGAATRSAPRIPKARLLALMHSLRSTVEGLSLREGRSEWSHYYEATNYSDEAMAFKEALVRRLVDNLAAPSDVVHDLGANTGRFSRLLAARGRTVVSHDIDDLAVECNYQVSRREGSHVLPLVLDLANPFPALGWALEERESALERIAGGTVVALALIHHLAISNNVPLDRVAALFARLARALVIEFVPKEDSQVQRLLASRQDIFPFYTAERFEQAFAQAFEILERAPVPGTVRTLYAMRRHDR
jgi:hypothetical protein